MKVVILTSRPYWKFLDESIKPYYGKDDDFWMSEVTTFPKEYDLGISFMHTYKVPVEQVNSHTWFNFHPAPLPEYKGRNLCYHAIMNGETEFGATLHYMDENFDTGDIINVRKFPILDWWTAEDVSRFTLMQSKIQFIDYLPRILAGEEFERKPNVGGTYYQKENINDFINMNYETVETFDRKVRAITYGDFYPKIEIGGVIYKVVRE